jgi:uncharacterized protein (DUF2126 family)/transglutaminase-like putative cysteine protease
MAIRVALTHRTRYLYDRVIEPGPHVVRLRPAAHTKAKVVAYSLKVAPGDHFENWQQDPSGNFLARYVFNKPTKAIELDVELIVDIATVNPFDFFLEEDAEKYPFTYDAVQQRELAPFLVQLETGPRFDQWLGRVRDDVCRPGRRIIDVLVDINAMVSRTLRYDIRMEPGVFTPDETLERGHGSCRDFAWLLVQTLRRLGMAARFVSGYSIQLVADQKPIEGPEGVTADCADLHAWAEVFLPGAGFVGLDATSGLFCGEGHIPLAATAEPVTAAPVTGSFSWHKDEEDDELSEELEVEMRVTRLLDHPRPTKPYTDAQWQAMLWVGDAVDRVLVENDVRLTMGGEPTFVTIDDLDAPEWNSAALGPTKALFADVLLRKLQKRFAPGGLLHHGQGKWYPGEPLPRWAYSCYFRHDGEPIWLEPSLIADGQGREQANAETARAFMVGLCERLGVPSENAIPTFEDVFYYLWRERQLPVNVDPFDSKIEDEIERDRLMRIFKQGLRAEVGQALPLRAVESTDGTRKWETGRWFLRDERLYLVPGDSAMGYRLPLDSLPWTAPADREVSYPRDPFEPRASLPKRVRPQIRAQAPGDDPNWLKPPPLGESAGNIVRTALCIEPRGGTLHVFMPPVEVLEGYLELAAMIEDTAATLGMPVRLEGYHPPSDPRMTRLQVTPDPGVIEVNIQPSRSWRESVDITTGLYEDARSTRLSADRFMLDGRQMGTGGGNHVVLGGMSPADSPFLRRPDLLRSFITYWINHPGLSYTFAGLFVGPTSQAPRLDEARQESIYELQIANEALSQVAAGGAPPPWLVDRIYRNLLVDVTGNTHRTEMCIDKMYSPDGPAGRLGLLEMRAFEMPPDPRMSCAQQLLVRSLLASFWQKPYDKQPVRWSTGLHDKFFLPHFAWKDVLDVVADLQHSGFALDPEWFLPHWEMRFPTVGTVHIDDVQIELRNAIEPWHVLGEEPGAGGTTRFVDSSSERVQAYVRNFVPERHVLAVNGRRVPLYTTGTPGEHVAGVRFRAWRQPNSLHPTIPLDAPLVFDLIDTWNDRSIGGCTYHVSHPGGLSYEKFPRNPLEAESRRISRFQPFGHTPGPQPAPPVEARTEMPLTLDLRRAAP